MKFTKHAFTLIELLVVIAIIAILAAILFPVFAQAREKARASSCLSNMKQLGTALQLYVDDYEETMPFAINHILGNNATPPASGLPGAIYKSTDNLCFGHENYYTWMDAIFPYVKNVNLYHCPTAPKNVSGYGMNGMLCTQYNMSDLTNRNDIIQAGGVECGKAMAQIISSAKTVFVSEAPTLNDVSWTMMGPAVIADYDNRLGIGEKSAVRHTKGLNFTFCDGHAKYYKYTQGPTQNVGGVSCIYSWGNGAEYWDPAVN